MTGTTSSRTSRPTAWATTTPPVSQTDCDNAAPGSVYNALTDPAQCESLHLKDSAGAPDHLLGGVVSAHGIDGDPLAGIPGYHIICPAGGN